MANLDPEIFEGFLDYPGLDYFKEQYDILTDSKIAVETDRATKKENELDEKKVDKTVLENTVSDIQSKLDAKAPLDSPSLTGIPTAPTAVTGTNTTQVATTEFVRGEISALVNGAPETMDTLDELSKAIAEHQEVTDALDAAITNKVDKVEGKGLSTNDYTDEEKAKVATNTSDIEANSGRLDTVEGSIEELNTKIDNFNPTSVVFHFWEEDD